MARPIPAVLLFVLRHLLAGVASVACAAHAQATGLGMTQLAQAEGRPTTLYYPTRAAEAPLARGPFTLSVALDAPATAGNGRLVVVSHGSGGSPWVHADLARALVRRGFMVAIPLHEGDNFLDPSTPGPESWRKRPAEIGAAIDALAAHPLGAGLSLDAVGVFGGSAGGHTALSLAGGAWSPRRFRDHCEANIERDFSSCVGSLTLLRGDWLDGAKVALARQVIRYRFTDAAPHRHVDPRVRAVVAMVPFAADFDLQSLVRPSIALGLVLADKDVNQVPAFHGDAVAAACAPRCEVIRLPDASHGAMLSPMPPLPPGSVARFLLEDPPGFDRAGRVPELNGRIADFFVRHLFATR